MAHALAKKLGDLGHKTIVVREPGTTTLGEAVRSLLLDGDHMSAWAEAFLFAAQRAQLVDEVVAPALARGTWVISDRSYYSSIAYQGGARGLGLELMKEINEAGLGDTTPDLVVVLDVPVELALDRQHRPDRIGSEQSEFHRAVLEAYAELARREPEKVVLVDNTLGVDRVVEQIMSHIT